MSQHSLKLPDHLEDAAVKIAQKKGLSLNQFFVAAIAEKISALEADDLLNNMAEKSDERAFFDALAKVPDGDVIEGGRMHLDWLYIAVTSYLDSYQL